MAKNNINLPLSVLTELMLNRGGTELILPLIKTDKRAPSVRSIYNIPYTRDHENAFLQFDWHCPASVAETVFKATAPTVFYIHGGAWSSADKRVYSRLSKEMAECGYIVINMNFRLMPEFDLRTHYRDCITCMRYCLKRADLFGIDKNNIFIAGDSSGGHMAALIGGRINAEKVDVGGNVAGLLLYYGIYDLNNLKSVKFRICNKLHEGFADIMKDKLARFYREYSPVTYINSNFPPSFITAGEVDGLHTESLLLDKMLTKANVPHKTLIFHKERKDARHAFINLINDARAEATNEMYSFMKEIIK